MPAVYSSSDRWTVASTPCPTASLAPFAGRAVIGCDGVAVGEIEDVEDVVPGLEADGEYLWVSTPDGEAVLVPVAAVARVTPPAVRLTCPGGEAAAAPRYDPGVPEVEYLRRVAAHYARPGRG